MKHRLIRLLCILLIIAGLSGSIGDVLKSEVVELSYPSPYWEDFKSSNRPAGRSLSSIASTHDTALIAALDGTIHLVESNSRKLLWSFTSGTSIYSSYQDNQDNDKENASGPSGGFFVDCGDDWELYAHTKHFGKMKLSMTVEEFISSTPHISEDGGVTLGSKKTTVFLVDAKTGRLIYTYRSSDSASTLQSDEEKSVLYNKNIEDWVESGSTNQKNVELPLYITRTDYLLQSFAPNSDKVVWNMTVAEIGAAFLCQDIENPIGGAPLNSGYELGSESGGHFDMPLPCQSKAVVYRFRNRNMLESFSRPDRLLDAHHGDVMLPVSAPNHMLPSRPKDDKFFDFHHDNVMLSVSTPNSMLPSQPDIDKYSDLHHNDSEESLPLPPSKIKNSGIFFVHDVRMHYNDVLSMFSKRSVALSIVVFFVILVGFFVCHYALVAREQVELNKQPSNSDAKTVPSKRKKIRKSGKSNGSVEKQDKHLSSENEDGLAHIQSDNKPLLNLNKLVDGGADGRRIGKLCVSNKEIAKGSNGTIVLEGIYEGRPVAVKRLVQAHHDVAFKEIQNLIASDRHPNIVRWYGVEYDQDFVYLSLERCTCSLDDLIHIYSDSSQNTVFTEEQASRSIIEYKVRLDSMKGIMRDINLWKENGYPSPLLLQLMRDMVSGLVHLHELGIIHRDLKPQNVLIIKERSLCAKLSDMGISKRLLGDMSSLGHYATGCGSSGWQAPEQLLHGRQTRAVDLFGLGCVLFFCITGGRHPFGDRLERDVNIVKNQVDLFLVESIPEALDIFSHLLNPDPDLRPKALEVLHHPLFWSSELRLSFLHDTSDRVELEDRGSNSDLLKALESIAPMALGTKWDEKLEPAFIANIGHYRRYRFDSVRDLLRVMRNKLNHYRELPKEIQEILGPIPEGFDGYFASRFPKLLIEVYKVVYRYCREEECFQKYLKSNVV